MKTQISRSMSESNFCCFLLLERLKCYPAEALQDTSTLARIGRWSLVASALWLVVLHHRCVLRSIPISLTTNCASCFSFNIWKMNLEKKVRKLYNAYLFIILKYRFNLIPANYLDHTTLGYLLFYPSNNALYFKMFLFSLGKQSSVNQNIPLPPKFEPTTGGW